MNLVWTFTDKASLDDFVPSVKSMFPRVNLYY